MEDDGFTIVSAQKRRRKRGKNKKLGLNHIDHEIKASQGSESINLLMSGKLEDIQCEIRLSKFYSSFKKDFEDIYFSKASSVSENAVDIENDGADDNRSIPQFRTLQIVCYGLGRFTSCKIALYQLAFLILLKDEWKPEKLQIYDPIFNEQEISILKKLGLDVLDVNEKAKRTVTCDTLFFMPHCDLFLYDNLLSANWCKKNLQSVIIVGNSLTNYNFSLTKRKFIEQAYFVYRANDFSTEVPLSNEFKYQDIFNDLSIHYFKCADLSKVPEDVWSDNGNSSDSSLCTSNFEKVLKVK